MGTLFELTKELKRGFFYFSTDLQFAQIVFFAATVQWLRRVLFDVREKFKSSQKSDNVKLFCLLYGPPVMKSEDFSIFKLIQDKV